MKKLKITKGEKFGKLTVLKEGYRKILPSGQINRTVDCLCDCGNKTNLRLLHLSRGRVKSCGCITKTMNGESTTDIGLLFSGLKSRCSDYHSERHLYYDKGIRVCDEWLNDFYKFKSWCIDNGFKKELQIDRIDGDKGYNPDNCRFVTPKVNSNNRINTYFVTYKNKEYPLSILLEELSFPNKYSTVLSRLNRGWELKDAIFKKPASNYKNRKTR